ncbi:YwbE family protein [Deinococcus yunweiensis]|uniref:YwbE family protein n=1 Tax=Deinococcus yunweiensis TaxID=367282 RepID=UPI00398F6255
MLHHQIYLSLLTDIVQKWDQPTGTLTRGVVAAMLTRAMLHPHGIKARLTNGQVGGGQQSGWAI